MVVPTQPGGGPVVRPARIMRVLHGILTAGLTMLGAVFVAANELAHLPHVLGRSIILGNALAGASIVIAAFALLMLRTRIPDRRADQTPDVYWTDIATRGSALLTWAVLDGAGTLGAVSYLLTGQYAALGAVVAAILALGGTGPRALERAG